MRIKSYFADSVQEAIEKARVELGPDAMLMNSKKTDFELRALGSFEVVFGLPGQMPAAKPRLQRDAFAISRDAASVMDGEATQAPGNAASGEVAQELAELRRQIETVRRSMQRQSRSAMPDDGLSTVSVDKICARLTTSGIGEDLAQEIAEAVELQAFAWKESAAHGLRDYEIAPPETIELALQAELERRLQVSPELGMPGIRQKVVLLVGPAGAGKTTSLIKLGLRYGLQARLPMHIFSVDTLRVGGWEHLASYARIAGLGFDAVHSLSMLDQRLAEQAAKRLILIDTPGFGPSDQADLETLGAWIQKAKNIDVHLVLPVTLRASVAARVRERFLALKPTKVLLTHADEAESEGALIDSAMRCNLPISYISNGQTIPEDIAQAVKRDLLAGLNLRPPERGNQAAA